MTVRGLHGTNKTHYHLFFLHETMSAGWHKQNRNHKPKIPPINWVYLALLRSQSLKKKTTSYDITIIITSLTTNFMDGTCWLLALILFNYSSFHFGWNRWRKVYWQCKAKCVIIKEKRLLHKARQDNTPVNNYRKRLYVNENLFIKLECFMNCIKFHKLEISNCMSLLRGKNAFFSLSTNMIREICKCMMLEISHIPILQGMTFHIRCLYKVFVCIWSPPICW